MGAIHRGPGAGRLPRGRAAALTIVLLSALAPAGARAATQAVAQTGVVIDDPMTVIGVEDMDFGQIAARANPGTVRLSPGATASCATTGGLTRTGTCRAARFDGDVTFLYTLQVQRPTANRIDLTGPGGATMRVRDFTFSGGPGMLDLGQSGANRRFLVLNISGNYTVYAGATLEVGAYQAPGLYTGTFQVQFNYN